MQSGSSLNRFLSAQDKQYETALAEIRSGKKRSHWMWYIFPQIAGLGFSDISRFYALQDMIEAQDYLQHPVLGGRLIHITHALLQINGKDARKIFGTPDDVKLRSCMTLFAALPKTDPVFQAALDKFFNGAQDNATLRLLKKI